MWENLSLNQNYQVYLREKRGHREKSEFFFGYQHGQTFYQLKGQILSRPIAVGHLKLNCAIPWWTAAAAKRKRLMHAVHRQKMSAAEDECVASGILMHWNILVTPCNDKSPRQTSFFVHWTESADRQLMVWDDRSEEEMGESGRSFIFEQLL